MMRTSVLKLTRAQPVPARTFSVLAARAVEGGTNFGSGSQGDAFQKREEASEKMYIRQKERENLLKLKEKLQQQRAHLDELDKHIDELEKSHNDQQTPH